MKNDFFTNTLELIIPRSKWDKTVVLWELVAILKLLALNSIWAMNGKESIKIHNRQLDFLIDDSPILRLISRQ